MNDVLPINFTLDQQLTKIIPTLGIQFKMLNVFGEFFFKRLLLQFSQCSILEQQLDDFSLCIFVDDFIANFIQCICYFGECSNDAIISDTCTFILLDVGVHDVRVLLVTDNTSNRIVVVLKVLRDGVLGQYFRSTRSCGFEVFVFGIEIVGYFGEIVARVG